MFYCAIGVKRCGLERNSVEQNGRFLCISVCFLLLSLPGHYRVTDEALLAETTLYNSSSFL